MIYNLIITLYISAVRVAALFNKKVSRMVKGEKETFSILKSQIKTGEKYFWFHAASLGELCATCRSIRPVTPNALSSLHSPAWRSSSNMNFGRTT